MNCEPGLPARLLLWLRSICGFGPGKPPQSHGCTGTSRDHALRAPPRYMCVQKKAAEEDGKGQKQDEVIQAKGDYSVIH